MSLVKVGDKVENLYGEVVEVLMVYDDTAITVQFLDKYKWITVCSVEMLCEGTITSPYSPTVHGVGCIGVDVNGKKITNHSMDYSYKIWCGMLGRCYSKLSPDSNYSDVSVDVEWRNYSSFRDWFDYELENFVWWTGDIEIDKDILTPLRIYGPDTSCLVPTEINQLIRRVPGKDGLLPGVTKYEDMFRVVPGYQSSKVDFYSEKDAHLAYVDSKSLHIKSVAKKYRTKIKPDVYDALVSRDFRFLFSPLFKCPPFEVKNS